MNEYIFYTPQGNTTAPNEEFSVENCQILGTAFGADATEAQKHLLSDNPWIAKAGFSPSEFIVRQIFTGPQYADIKALVEYLWQDEERHYEESNRPVTHIFESLRRLRAIVP